MFHEIVISFYALPGMPIERGRAWNQNAPSAFLQLRIMADCEAKVVKTFALLANDPKLLTSFATIKIRSKKTLNIFTGGVARTPGSLEIIASDGSVQI